MSYKMAILKHAPTYWTHSHTGDEQADLQPYSDEFKQIAYEARYAIENQTKPIVKITRIQNIHDLGQLLIREQLLVVANPGTSYYRKIQDNLIKDTFTTQVEISNVRKNNYKYTKKSSEEDNLFDKNFELLEENKNAEESGGFNSGLCKVYKAKIKSLIAEKEHVQIELRQKSEEARKLQKENQLFKEEKEKWFLSYNAGKNNIGKLESQVTNVNARLQSKEAENLSLKKEVENLKKELRSCNLNFNNCDVRLTRACEEADKLKSALKQSREEEKELKDGYRKHVNELMSTIKRIEKQKIELLNGFKKQMQLIDVLKKEKIHLEAFKVGEMTEAEYARILEWKFD